MRNHLNLVIVFFLCGLWHGASWTFVIWGIYNGFFLVLERTRFGGWMDRIPRPARHVYAIIVVMMGWVLFRSNTCTAALHYFLALFGQSDAITPHLLVRYLSHQSLWALAFGVLFSGPLWSTIKTTCSRIGLAAPVDYRPGVMILGATLETVLIIGLMLVSVIFLAGSTYNPFIYFRF